MLFGSLQFLFQRLIGLVCFASGLSEDAGAFPGGGPLPGCGLVSVGVGFQTNVGTKSPGKIVHMQILGDLGAVE